MDQNQWTLNKCYKLPISEISCSLSGEEGGWDAEQKGTQRCVLTCISQNPSMVEFGRNLWGSSSLTLLLKQGHPEQFSQDGIQEVLYVWPDLGRVDGG